MLAVFDSTIVLPTRSGNFEVTYVTAMNGSKLVREGVLLHKKLEKPENEVLVRVQSSCLFSESFWATDCDCALQLQTAMQLIANNGGYLLYFYEEGRGAGLRAKFQAIQLQQVHHFDTVKAYECLNMKVDERSYEAASSVLLKAISTLPIVLLTNNENKVNGLKAYGVNIVRRQALLCGLDKEPIRNYLQEKKKTLGHIIP